MGLADNAALRLRQRLFEWRRRIIAGAIALLLALAAISYVLSAIRVLIEQWLGVAGGRLLLAVICAFGAIAAGALAWTISKPERATDEKSGRVAAIVEAVGLGYDLAQDVKAMFSGASASASAGSSADVKRAKKARADARRENPRGDSGSNAPL